MSEEIKGNFDDAIHILIERLVRAKSSPGIGKFASELLYDWDQRRGNDWYTSTKKSEQIRGHSVKYCFRQDESCHWYMIPFNKSDLFSELHDNDNNWEEFCDEFDNYRIDGSPMSFTFENPKEV